MGYEYRIERINAFAHHINGAINAVAADGWRLFSLDVMANLGWWTAVFERETPLDAEAEAAAKHPHLTLVPDPEWPIASAAAAAPTVPWTPERTAQQGTASLIPPGTVIYRQWVSKQPTTT